MIDYSAEPVPMEIRP